MAKCNFMVLLSLKSPNATVSKGVLARLQRDVDPDAAVIWLDPRGVGVFVSTSMRAREVWLAAIPETLSTLELEALRDLLILQLGSDCQGFPQNMAMVWLNARRHA